MSEVTLTPGADIVELGVEDDVVTGTAETLNPGTDYLDGGDGFDTLTLFGAGTYDLNALATYVNFEQVVISDITGGTSVLTLKEGSESDVLISGTGSVTTNTTGTTIIGTYQGGDGQDFVNLSDDSSATTIHTGADNDVVNLSGSANATTIDLGTGRYGQYGAYQGVNLSDNASVTTILGTSGAGDYAPFTRITLSGNASATTIDLSEAPPFFYSI